MQKNYIAALLFAITFAITTTFSLLPNKSVYAIENTENNLTLSQIKGQIYLYNQALNEFGARNQEQAAEIWARGFKYRNGVMQYSVLCDDLKKDWIIKMGEPTNSFWIIGVSSPWLGDYKVVKDKKINNSSCKITVRLHWIASSYSSYEEKVLTILKNKNGNWCISEIK